MNSILFVLGADGLQNVGIGQQSRRELDREGLGVHLRVIDRDLDVHVTEVAPPEPFDQMKRFAVRVAEPIQPGSVVKAHRIDDQRIALPPPRRVAPAATRFAVALKVWNLENLIGSLLSSSASGASLTTVSVKAGKHADRYISLGLQNPYASVRNPIGAFCSMLRRSTLAAQSTY
jgi:hypothetical protein